MRRLLLLLVCLLFCYLLDLLLKTLDLFVFLGQLLLHVRLLQQFRGHLTDLTEHRLVGELCSLDQAIGLVDRVHQDWDQFVVLLAELDRVVDSVLDVDDHVLGALELELAQVHFDFVEFAHGLVVGDELVRLLDTDHEVRMPTHVSYGLEQVSALLHDGAVDLDTSLLGRLGTGHLVQVLCLRQCLCWKEVLGEDLARASVNALVVFLGLHSA